MNWTMFPRPFHYKGCKGHCNDQGFIVITDKMDSDLQ